jgi:hypothetical protein
MVNAVWEEKTKTTLDPQEQFLDNEEGWVAEPRNDAGPDSINSRPHRGQKMLGSRLN